MNHDELSALEPRLRELAARLVRDPHEAEEVVQETYLAALGARPDLDRGVDGWLRRILRAKARQSRRRELRRRALEGRLPRALSDPGSEEDVRHRRRFLGELARELEHLREPYRATLRARFLEGLAPHELARREGLPVRTVHTRVARGLALLRDALERRAGRPGRRALVASWWRRAARGRALRWAAAGLVAVAGPWLWLVAWGGGPAGGSEVALAAGGASPARDRAPDLVAPGDAPDPGRVAVPDPREVETTRAPAEPERVEIAGRVVDVAGDGVDGLEVAFEVGGLDAGPAGALDFRFVPSGEVIARATSEAEGAFRLAVPADARGRVTASGPARRTVRAALVQANADPSTPTVVVAPAAPLAGRVLDAAGRAVAGARVVLRPPEELLVRPAGSLRAWLPTVLETESAADGSFRIGDAFDLDGARLEVRAQGFEERAVVLDRARAADVVLEVLGEGRRRGTLRLPSGEPARGRVVVSGRMVETDEEGRFVLDPRAAPGDEVWGFVPERLPARGTAPACGELDLVVGPPSLALEGRVVDADGAPLSGAFVWTVDPTPLDPRLEAFFAETHLNPVRDAPVPFYVLSDEEGRFRVPFLLDRAYRLAALQRETLLAVRTEPVDAGTRDVELRVPTDAARTPVAGVVIDRAGEPVAGARVSVHGPMVRVVDEEGRTLTSSFRGPSRPCGPDGRFELPPVPEQDLFLDVTAEGFTAASPPLPCGAARATVEIVLARRAVLEVAWSEASGPATHFVVLGDGGRVLDLVPAAEVDLSHGVVPRARAPLAAGGTSRVLTPDSGRTVVVYDGEREVARLPIVWGDDGSARVGP